MRAAGYFRHIATQEVDVTKVIHCECGADVSSETEDGLVEAVEAHVQDKHPELVGTMTREQILGMAHEH